jgi:hypothetical protein
MEHPYQILVRTKATGQPWQGLVPMLESLLPVKFISPGQDGLEVAGEIITDPAVGAVKHGVRGHIGSLSLPQANNLSPQGKPVNISVNFQDDPAVPFPFRGRSIQAKTKAEPQVLTLGGNERSLARCERGPVWTVADEEGVKHFRSGFTLPEISADTALHNVLNEGCFLEMLPLISWLREICKKTAFAGPPLRACFIFDDPNLHWTSYGFVDFRQIATQATKENYHVAFATIPLDAWFTHDATANVFKSNPDRLSLVVHGNDHTRQELARDYTPSARVSLLRRAIDRIERLEKKTGLRVGRVMVPPHGACSEEMLKELPGCGFEAACISHGSLRAHNRGRSWTRNLGFHPSTMIQGCPVLPRWGLGEDVTNTILLAAFLGQPIVLRGHHQDLKNGVGLLDNIAGFINRLGPVSWSNMQDLCRINYQWRMDGSICRVKPLARKIVFRLPEGATQLVIENSFLTDWQISGINGEALAVRAGQRISLPEIQNREISMVAAPAQVLPAQNGVHRTPMTAWVRRVLTEGRDRLLPLSRTY